MVTVETKFRNGMNGQGGNDRVDSTDSYTLECASDYPPAPTLTVPMVVRPGWQSEFPRFTLTRSWVDADGHSLSMTMRSDDLPGLISDSRMLRAMIKQSREQHAARAGTPAEPAYVPDIDVPNCKVHGTAMIRRVSKRTQGVYFSHDLPNGDRCFGREKKA